MSAYPGTLRRSSVGSSALGLPAGDGGHEFEFALGLEAGDRLEELGMTTKGGPDKATRDAIKSAGARLIFLPAYSPDLNPIEQTFSKIKSVLRKAMGRTVADVEAAIKAVIPTISPTECQNYFRNAGYASFK